MKAPPYRTLGAFLHERFGRKVWKIPLDAGLSCPHRDAGRKGGCIYCSARGSGTGAYDAGLSVAEQLARGIEKMSRRAKVGAFIAYFQSFSNTYAPLETLTSLYDCVLDFPEVVGMAIGTRPDCIDEARLDLVSWYARERIVWMEYGLQSAHDDTLRAINRGHDVQAFVDAVNLTRGRGLRQCAHVIIGLPGEGMDHYIETARFVSSLPVTDVKIHLLYVILGTPLEDMLRNDLYRPLDLQEYAQAAAMFIGHLRQDIVIQRITGDPRPDELAAPAWALNKTAVLQEIARVMERLGITQGSLAR